MHPDSGEAARDGGTGSPAPAAGPGGERGPRVGHPVPGPGPPARRRRRRPTASRVHGGGRDEHHAAHAAAGGLHHLSVGLLRDF